MSYKVRLDIFEGPLDLLLHLINRLEIDIHDIPMAQLTEQYIDHLHTMRVLQLDELSEYLVLAATLIEIKSKMLLPVHEAEFNEDSIDFEMEEDPREELVARLIEYRQYKEAATHLKMSADERDAYFTKPTAQIVQFSKVVETTTHENLNVFDLIGAFQKMMKRRRLRAPLTANIEKNEQSVNEKMDEIMSQLERNQGKCHFETLFQQGNITELVVTFMSLLELMMRKDILVEQDDNFEQLTISFCKECEMDEVN